MTEEARSFDGILAAMKSRYKELAGCDSDEASDVGIRMRVLAKELAELEARLILLREQVFPETSTGLYLDRHAAARGLARKEAAASEGTLRFSRDSAAAADLPIPAGTVAVTRFTPPLRFATTVAGVLKAGEFSAEVPASALVPGAGGNVAAGAIGLLAGELPGFTAVTNPEPFGCGLDEESDDMLRERLLEAFRNVANGANAAYYHALAMREPGVLSAGVIPRARGRGTVDVVVQCAAGISAAETAARLNEVFERDREINVDVLVKSATLLPIAIEVELVFDGKLDVTVVAEQCGRRIREHVDGLKVGEPLYLATLYRLMLEVGGVLNAHIVSPGKDVLPDAYTALSMGVLTARNRLVTA